MKFDVLNKWTGKVQFSAEIKCDDSASVGLKIGLAVLWAWNNRAVLRDAVLRDAVLRGADLRDADLSGAALRGSDLSDADLRDADLSGVPIIPDIHKVVYAAAAQPGALDMSQWHCGTAHCRAGWVVTLAGEAGKTLEFCLGTPVAAALIYLASDPKIERIPNFYCANAEALADMARLAGVEVAA